MATAGGGAAHGRDAVLLVIARGVRGDSHRVDGVVGISGLGLANKREREEGALHRDGCDKKKVAIVFRTGYLLKISNNALEAIVRQAT